MTQNILPFLNPATGEQFGEVAMATETDVCDAARELRVLAPQWAGKSVRERAQILRQLQALMVDELDKITAVINGNNGKSRQDALSEVFITADMLNQYTKHAPHWLRRRRVSPGLQIFKKCYTEQRPYGLAAIISPWNYPFILTMNPLFAALLAGNVVMVKPSEVTPAIGVMMEGLIQRIPELAPFVRFLHGDGRIGAALVQTNPDIIYLTGSTRTGQLVMKAAADTLTPVIFELGGKDPMIVLEDADIAAAARWGVWGAFYNTGQTCMGIERVYVVSAVYDAFLEAVIAETKQLKVGYSPEIQNPNHVGPMTFAKQFATIDDHIEDALAKGAEIVVGGPREGMFMPPTVMVNVDHGMKLMQEETFGPIMPIMKVTDETHAIQLANHSDLGLSAAVWSQDQARAMRVAQQLNVGSVIVNDTIVHFAIPNLPFGGVKLSGHGRAHGEQDVMQFSQTHSYVTSQPPYPFDIATILRSPGNYKLGAAIMRLALGVTPKQRLQPVAEFLAEQEIVPQKVGRWAAAVGLTAAIATFLFTLFRPKK